MSLKPEFHDRMLSLGLARVAEQVLELPEYQPDRIQRLLPVGVIVVNGGMAHHREGRAKAVIGLGNRLVEPLFIKLGLRKRPGQRPAQHVAFLAHRLGLGGGRARGRRRGPSWVSCARGVPGS